MRLSQGRSPIGVRAQNRVPAIRTRNMNVMAAIHDAGMTHFSFYNEIVMQRNVHTSLMIWQQQETDYKFQPML